MTDAEPAAVRETLLIHKLPYHQMEDDVLSPTITAALITGGDEQIPPFEARAA